MAIPSRDDPRWPLFLAVRNLSAFSMMLLLIGGLVSVPLFVHGDFWTVVAISLVLLSPGAVLFFLTVMVYRRHRWAAVVAIVLLSAIGLALAFVLVVLLRRFGVIDLALGRNLGGGLLVVLTTTLLFMAGKAIYRLSGSFAAMALPALQDTGFEPVMQDSAPKSVLPAEAVHDGADDAAAAR
jgi:hypothetical protein